MENKRELNKYVPSDGWRVDPTEQSDAQFDLDGALLDFATLESSGESSDPVILVPMFEEYEEIVTTSEEPEAAVLPSLEETIFEFDPIRTDVPFMMVDSAVEERNADQDSVENIFDVMELVPVRER